MAALLLSTIILAPAAHAQGAKYQEQISQFEQFMGRQEARDSTGLAEKDRARTRGWLKDVEVLLAREEKEQAERLLKQAEFAITMMEAMIKAVEIEALADQQEAAFFKAQEEHIPKLEAEIEALEGERQALEDELTKSQD